MSNQWGYMNPETYVAKPKQVKGLGMLESKSSDSDSDAESETETRKKAESMLAEMAKFLDTMEKDENSKAEKEKSKKRKKEEKKENNEPNRWGPWTEYFDQETKHPYYFNSITKETVWKLSENTKKKYERENFKNDEKEEKESSPKPEKKKIKKDSDDETKKSESRRSPSPRRRDRSRRRSLDRQDREKDVEKKAIQIREKLNFFKFNRVPKSLHKLTQAHIEIEVRFTDFKEGKLDADYFATKLKEYNKEVKAFEDTAAPSGYSLLWDDADKKYGYINNFTGEVTQEYPTGNKPKKQTTVETESYRKNVVDLNKDKNVENKPWKYTEDGSISGILGGGEKKKIEIKDSSLSSSSSRDKNSSRDKILSQTDILKDSIHIEKAKSSSSDRRQKPIRNEKEDRRLARLGIQIDPVPSSPPRHNNGSSSTSNGTKLEPEKNAKEGAIGSEKADLEESDGNMEISSESESETPKKSRKKKRKKEKNSKSSKTKLGLMENWKRRQEDEQASLWNQLGI